MARREPKLKSENRVPVTDASGNVSHVFAHDYLTSDMTRSQLIEALTQLPLRRPSNSCVVVLDREVRDHLLAAIAGR
jgi:hypothetical protein